MGETNIRKMVAWVFGICWGFLSQVVMIDEVDLGS